MIIKDRDLDKLAKISRLCVESVFRGLRRVIDQNLFDGHTASSCRMSWCGPGEIIRTQLRLLELINV